MEEYDVWEIDTTKINNKWFLDLNLYKSEVHICTPEKIPPQALTLRKIGQVTCPYCETLDWGRSVDIMLRQDGNFLGMWCGYCRPKDELDFLEEYYE